MRTSKSFLDLVFIDLFDHLHEFLDCSLGIQAFRASHTAHADILTLLEFHILGKAF